MRCKPNFFFCINDQRKKIIVIQEILKIMDISWKTYPRIIHLITIYCHLFCNDINGKKNSQDVREYHNQECKHRIMFVDLSSRWYIKLELCHNSIIAMACTRYATQHAHPRNYIIIPSAEKFTTTWWAPQRTVDQI